MDWKISILVFTRCFRFACCPFVAFDDRCHSFFRFLILFCLLTACTKEFPLEFIQCFPETGNCFFQVIDGFLQFCDGPVFSSNRSESIWIIRSFCLVSLLKSMSCPFGSTVNPSLFFVTFIVRKGRHGCKCHPKSDWHYAESQIVPFFSQNQPVSGIFRKVMHIMMMSCTTIPGQRAP